MAILSLKKLGVTLQLATLCAFVTPPAKAEDLTNDEGTRLPEKILAEKREGSYLTGVPAIAYGPDSGFIYGVVLFHYVNGSKEDPRFAITPYLQKTTLLAVQSTKGLSQLKIDLDLPRFANSKHRLKPSLAFTNNISEQYFGDSEAETMRGLTYPTELAAIIGQSETSDFKTYETELQKKRSDGRTWFRYNQYIEKSRKVAFADEITVISPQTSLLLEASGSRTDISDYSGKSVDAIDPDNSKEVKAEMAETLLHADQRTNGVPGYEGGFVNGVSLGISFDNRDFEPDPSSGVFAAFTGFASRKELGSDYSFARYRLNTRGFFSPTESLTLGSQFQYEWVEGDCPFWALPNAGGRNSLKGYRISRLKGMAASQFNSEARWRATNFKAGSQDFVLTPLLYLDFARVYDQTVTLSTEGWRRGTGLGLRVIWNQATVIGFERPIQGEEKNLYVNINHIF